MIPNFKKIEYKGYSSYVPFLKYVRFSLQDTVKFISMSPHIPNHIYSGLLISVTIYLYICQLV